MDTGSGENQIQLAVVDIVFQIVEIVLNTFVFLTQQVLTIFFSGFIPSS